MSDERKEEDGYAQAVAVMDGSLLPVIRSLLEGTDIPFFIRNEETQNLFGFGQTGTGFNLITGPPIVMVGASRVEEARELLAPLVAPLSEDAVPEDENGPV